MNLSRVLEPELMDDDQEAIDYDEMDHAEVNRQFVADLLAAGEKTQAAAPRDTSDGDMNVWLDIGVGTAQIPIHLCQQRPEVRVLGIDLARAMLNVATYNVESHSLLDSIQLQLIDAKELPYPDDSFPVVMSNSIVHHIPEPQVCLAEAYRVARPGGLLFFRDLARPASESQLQQLVTTYAAGESENARSLFEASLRAALTVEEVREMLEPLGCDPHDVQMTSDRHWTWSSHKRT